MKARKEITIAVIIGLIFGLIVVGGVIRAKTALERARETKPLASYSPANTLDQPQSETGLTLTLTTQDNQVVETGTLTIAGKTDPKGYVVILGEKGEYITTPSTTGTFSQEIALVKGANTIKITVYLENGSHTEATLTAIYTSGV